jgi:predicted transcriptional regulator
MTNLTSKATATFRLPVELHQKLYAYAKSSDQTRSQILRRLLSSYEPIKTHSPEPLPERSQWTITQR